MSSYIVVENGLIKKIVPNEPINIEFGNIKGYTYSSTMEAHPDSEFEDIKYPGKGGTGFPVIFKTSPIDENPLSKLVIKDNPIIDADGWTYTLEVKPVVLDMSFENLPDEVERIEYMTPQEMLDRDIISVEEYINLVNNR